MINSMTGYGRGTAEAAGRRFTVELRAVNHRFCEISVRGPRELMVFDDRVRREIGGVVSRGRIECQVTIQFVGDRPRQVGVDNSLAMAYYSALKELADLTGLPVGASAHDLASLPETLQVEDQELPVEEVWDGYRSALGQALHGLVVMRGHEGAALSADVLQRLENLRNCKDGIVNRAPLVVTEHRNRLQIRLAELLGDTVIDEQRLAQEIAILADRSDISEELSRLGSHCTQLENILNEGGEVGRKLEFLLQELNREINTIGAKTGDVEITRLVVQAKSELEKMREQVQNVE